VTTGVDWTVILGVVAAIAGGVVVPLWLQRRKRVIADVTANVVSWTKITEALQVERDRLRAQLDVADERHRLQVKNLEADWEQRMADARSRITQLEQEVSALRSALRGGGPM